MQERGLIGLEARAADGTEVGRIAEVVTDEESGEVTHVVVETEDGERLEVPITDLSLDPDADFATFEADASDVEPGDHIDDEVEPEDYAPDEIDDESEEDYEHEGQLVTDPEDEDEARHVEDLKTREDWEDDSYTPDSGFPRNDAYVDPDTGKVEVDPLLSDIEGVQHDVAGLLDRHEPRGTLRQGRRRGADRCCSHAGRPGGGRTRGHGSRRGPRGRYHGGRRGIGSTPPRTRRTSSTRGRRAFLRDNPALS